MNQKRNTLKKVAGVSAVVALAPTSWTKPVISSVILPAHAQTSFCLSSEIAGFYTTSADPMRGALYNIFENGTGTFSPAPELNPFTWSVSGDVITIDIVRLIGGTNQVIGKIDEGCNTITVTFSDFAFVPPTKLFKHGPPRNIVF